MHGVVDCPFLTGDGLKNHLNHRIGHGSSSACVAVEEGYLVGVGVIAAAVAIADCAPFIGTLAHAPVPFHIAYERAPEIIDHEETAVALSVPIGGVTNQYAIFGRTGKRLTEQPCIR